MSNTIVRLLRAFAAVAVVAHLHGCAGGGDGASQARHIELVDAITLEITSDSVDLFPTRPAVSGSGYIAASQILPPGGGVAVFDARGHYLYSVGKQGHGPDEISNLTSAGFGPGDTLWIVDGLLSAHAYSPPPASRYVRSIHFERQLFGDVTRYGIISQAIMRTNLVTPPALTDRNGAEVARFGANHPQSEAHHRQGAVFAVDSANIWSALGDEYAVELVA